METTQKQLEPALRRHGLTIAPEALEKLILYIQTLERFSKAVNLKSRREKNFLEKLLIPSLYPLKMLEHNTTHIIDIGSGGGLPAIPLMIAGTYPGTLIEKNAKKSAFLRYACSTLGLTCTVINKSFHLIKPEDLPTHATVTVRGLKVDMQLINFIKSLKPRRIILYEPPTRKPLSQLQLHQSIIVAGVSIREYTLTEQAD